MHDVTRVAGKGKFYSYKSTGRGQLEPVFLLSWTLPHVPFTFPDFSPDPFTKINVTPDVTIW